jgi:hypothetical protein
VTSWRYVVLTFAAYWANNPALSNMPRQKVGNGGNGAVEGTEFNED